MSPRKPRILAIDDMPGNLYTLGTALANDFDLEIATSGSQGLTMAKHSPPDLVLLDIMMPEMDGLETCRRFRSDPRLQAVPIIFLTALTDVDSEVTGLDLGVADYITKPFHLDIVKLRIRNTLKLASLNRELRASEERMRFVLDATGDGIWDWEIEFNRVSHNEAWCRMMGLDTSFLSHPLADYVERIHPEDLAAVERALDISTHENTLFTAEYRIRHSDGHYLWISDTGQVVDRDIDGKASRMVGCVKNIDERKRSEADIHRLAFFDALTELPNRRLLMDRLQQAIFHNTRNNSLGALLFLDMDHFKQLNDTHGHAMGDAMLIQVASRLRRNVREQDTVSRLGGDEFVVLLESLAPDPVSAGNAATLIGEKLLGALNSPYQLGSIKHHSSPSIGLTLFGGDNEQLDEILKRADHAMYEAKGAGRNTLRTLIDTEQLRATQPNRGKPTSA
uniref:PAS:GGDEF protein n=1 Tax=Dechloromonas aromatica (strain RCB) TaxID=159087 RepID=Q47F63_DECAR